MIKKVDHIAIAVSSVDEAAKFYEGQLGLKLALRQHVPERKVRVGFVPVGETRLELVEPDSPESPIARFLEKRGPGLQHICFEVDDCAAELARLAAAGVRLIDQTPQVGAHGAKVGFIHPSATGGVLIELNEPSSPSPL
jgi:methylmalonyl-CoA/ethylmalonyl-CoA epimerase